MSGTSAAFPPPVNPLPCGHTTALICPECWEEAHGCRHPADALELKAGIGYSTDDRLPDIRDLRLVTVLCTRCGEHVQLTVPRKSDGAATLETTEA